MSYKRLAEALLTEKAYFGPALRARQGLVDRHRYFFPLIRLLADSWPARPLELLEIGSWAGASAVSWCLAIREAGRDGRLTCVDPWSEYLDVEVDSDPHYQQMAEASRAGLIYSLFLHNLRATGVRDRVEVRRGRSADILPSYADGTFDLIYLDGSHQYADTAADIDQAKRLIRNGGVICGDDLELTLAEVQPQSHAQALASGKDYLALDESGEGYHPGVTQAVGEAFEAVSNWRGFWAVRKEDGQWRTLPDLPVGDRPLPQHLQSELADVELIEILNGYSLVRTGPAFFAISRSLGRLHLFDEQLGDRALPPVLLRSSTLEELRTEVLRSDAPPPPPRPDAPVLRDTYRAFNLVETAEDWRAIRRDLGPVDASLPPQELERCHGDGAVYVAASADALRLRIDLNELTKRLGEEALQRREQIESVNKEASGWREEIERTNGDIVRRLQATRQEIRDLLDQRFQAEPWRRALDPLQSELNYQQITLDRMAERIQLLSSNLEAERARLTAAARELAARVSSCENRAWWNPLAKKPVE